MHGASVRASAARTELASAICRYGLGMGIHPQARMSPMGGQACARNVRRRSLVFCLSLQPRRGGQLHECVCGGIFWNKYEVGFWWPYGVSGRAVPARPNLA